MSTSYLTTNMMLIIPVPGQQPGPDWSQNLNASLTIVDAHDHSPGSGVQVTPSGINITSDLSFNNAYNLTNPRSVRLYPNIAALSDPADIGCVYEAGVDLYYNDGDGNQIRITQSGSVAGSTGTITGLPSGTASAAYVGASGTFLFQQATSTGANFDVASIAIRYPGSYPTPSGNYIQLQAPSSLASGYSITLPALPGQTNVMTLGTSGTISSTTWDAIGQNMTSTGANAVANSRTRSTGAVIGAGGVAYSVGVSNSNNQTSPTSITNLFVTITTTGRPVVLTFISAAGAESYLGINPSLTASRTAKIEVRRNSTTISIVDIIGLTNIFIPPGSMQILDAVGAGTYTYQVYTSSSNNDTTVDLHNVILVAYEI